MKKVLIVAYHFPPVGGLGAAGAQRVLKFSRHLSAENWQPYVLTVRDSCYESWLTLDAASLDQVPDTVKVIRTGVFRVLGPILKLKRRLRPLVRGASPDEEAGRARPASTTADHADSLYQRVKDTFTDLFEIPDEVAGWFVPAVVSGVRTVRREGIDVIFASGRPWTSLVIGAAIKAIVRRPLVVDFRDPWMTNPFRLKYSGIKESAERSLEARVVRSADVIVANTDHLRDEFVARFGSLISEKCVTIINGFDADEFSRIRPATRPESRKEAFVLTHSGFLYGKRDPRTLLEAIRLLRDKGQIREGDFLCNLVGQVELPYDLSDYLRDHELSPFVQLTGQVAYTESLAQVAASDASLLLQPGTHTQIPSKLFEYIGLGQRIVTIAPPGSAVVDLVKANELGRAADPDDVEAIARALIDAMQDWRSRGEDRAIRPGIQARFEIRQCTKRLADELDRVSQ